MMRNGSMLDRNVGSWVLPLIFLLVLMACEGKGPGEGPSETDYSDLLANQVEEVIIPTMKDYQGKTASLEEAVSLFASDRNEANLTAVKAAYHAAYLSYQAAAVHNYFATVTQGLVNSTNLFPVDTALLAEFIENKTYNFSTTAQQRANGFPALDFLLYGPDDVLTSFQEDGNRMAFLAALVGSIKDRADVLVNQWTGTLKDNFVKNGGTALGSSISVQLNECLVYYEKHIRENKVGIPIGRLGPNDSPIEANPTLIEGYYQSLADGNEAFTLALLKAAIEEMEDLYLGVNSSDTNAQGYDDILVAREKSSVDTDIKTQFVNILSLIDNRSAISGDDTLYLGIQRLVTLYKSDLFSVLNVQDADGANDGD